MKNWYLMAYDIHDDKRLRQVAQIMEGYGTRLQFSVFRCFLSARELQRLRWELSRNMALDDDLLIVRLCNGCVDHIRATHHKQQWPDEPEYWTVI